MTLNSKINNEISDAMFNGVRTILSRRTTPWIGTMTELDASLNRVLRDRVPSDWPGSPSALRVSFNRVVNRLRNAGVSIRFTRSTDHTRTRLVRLSNNS